jgi:uncharacterized protein YdaU (DUF1376 family)
MSRGPVFVAFYASDYISGTRKIPPMERLVYMEIIALIYDEGGPIEYENRDLARFIGITAAVCKRAVDGLVKRRKITLEGGVISNERADRELAKAGARSVSAKASADARWAKTETKVGKVNQDFDQNRSPILPEKPNDINEPDMRTHPPRNATKTQNQIKTEEREVSADAQDAPASAPKAPKPVDPNPKARLPDGWMPTDDGMAYAEAAGIDGRALEDEVFEFIEYWQGVKAATGRKSARGWGIAWRKKVDRFQKFGGVRQTGNSAQAANGSGQPSGGGRTGQMLAAGQRYLDRNAAGRHGLG